MERQKQLMENLELEFAEVQEEYAAAVKSHQREVSEKESEIAALREKVDDDSVVALKQELVELEEALAAAKSTISDADAAASEARAEAQSSANAIQELESRIAEESTARQAQAENMAELEKQLKKQTQAAVEAELAAQKVRAELLEATAQESRVPDDVSDENEALQAEVIKLEGMVRERTEQLNKLRWQQDMIEKQGGSDSQDSKMLVVLNQQLQSAREENQRLKDKVRVLETAPAPVPAAVDPGEMDEPDDLSSIKGIGPKLVKQLRKLGITRFDQISMLSESDLDDQKHPLHAMKGRIIKDNWIEQAAKLGGIG
jgi:predicted flap endonuclease-1-like 5' DNA nuclease